MNKCVIALEGVVKKFGAAAAVNGVSVEVFDGDFFALLGPSGCGKTTLLRMIGGFDRPSAGRILMDGEDMVDLPPFKRPVNMLFQSYALFPHLNVRDNVGYGLRMERRPRAEIARRVDEALALTRMAEFAVRRPESLSGGQRQRVALARALVKKPRVLLLDEPLSALDAKLREAMRMELVRLQKTVGITFVVVTHDQDEALSMATRIAVMQEGVFRQVDTPLGLYESPNCRFVADFIGRMNMCFCTLLAARGDGCVVAMGGGEAVSVPQAAPDGGREGERLVYGVRPEKIAFLGEKPADGVWRAVVVEGASYFGDETLLRCRDAEGEVWECVVAHRCRGLEVPVAGAVGYLRWGGEDVVLLREE